MVIMQETEQIMEDFGLSEPEVVALLVDRHREPSTEALMFLKGFYRRFNRMPYSDAELLGYVKSRILFGSKGSW
ncbi:MAG: hypothetical protein GOV02_03875 [Candidatus Aenigmarchaeota archaeon]|nr:hypothetical protein [Candidatus Aenigmarchaeota archaeon]